MDNFRRTLLGGGSIDYVFSAQSTSVSVGYSSSSTNVNITSTANGTNIGYSVVSYDGTVVTRVTTAATRVTIYYSTNSTYDERNGNVVLMQNDSNKTITINVSQDAQPFSIEYDAILLDGDSGSYGSAYIGDNLIISSPASSLFYVTYSSGYIGITALSDNGNSTPIFDSITVRANSQSIELAIIQLPIDYHSRDYVSIGGTNWAIKNVGASSVQDYGNYYSYGKGSQTYTHPDSIYEGTEDPLASTADTATQVMGSGWRMPTMSECQALLTSTIHSWSSYNGVNVCVLWDDENALVFPAAGFYFDGVFLNDGTSGDVWSSTSGDSGFAYHIYVSSEDWGLSCDRRVLGFSVRGVYDPI